MSITNNLSKGILLYDNAEDLPIVNYTDSNSPWVGPWTYTGGTQNTASQSPNNNVSLSTTYKRLGTKSYRHYVKFLGLGNNDGPWGRGEWGYLKPGDRTLANEWRWHSISILIDPAVQFESRRASIAYDHKENPDTLETPFYLAIVNDHFALYGRFVGDPYFDLGPITKGVWYDFTLERNWRTDNSGFMRFYVNGVKKWERLNQPNHGGVSMSPIDRIQDGWYKWAWYGNQPEGPGTGPGATSDLILYTDEIKFGNANATLADMLPSGTIPGPDPGPDPSPTGAIRINSGGKKNLTFNDDQYFVGGDVFSTTSPITGAVNAAIYQTERFKDHSYEIPVKNGPVDVTLHFAEIFWTAAGQRLFNVDIEGARVLTNFDILKTAGGKDKAYKQTFRADVKDGKLSIKFASVKDHAKVSAIEVVPVVVPDLGPYVKGVALRKQVVDGVSRDVSVTTFNDGTEQVITKKGS